MTICTTTLIMHWPSASWARLATTAARWPKVWKTTVKSWVSKLHRWKRLSTTQRTKRKRRHLLTRFPYKALWSSQLTRVSTRSILKNIRSTSCTTLRATSPHPNQSGQPVISLPSRVKRKVATYWNLIFVRKTLSPVTSILMTIEWTPHIALSVGPTSNGNKARKSTRAYQHSKNKRFS